MEKTVLFPGRFQPFHNAHLAILKRLLGKYGKVIVAIGSSNIKNRNNPFSALQRKEMVWASLSQAERKHVSFAFIPRARDSRWVGALLKAVPRDSFDVIFTNNPRVKRQLKKHGIPFVSSKPIRRAELEGRKIRRLEKGWKNRVPKAVAAHIRKAVGPGKKQKKS